MRETAGKLEIGDRSRGSGWWGTKRLVSTMAFLALGVLVGCYWDIPDGWPWERWPDAEGAGFSTARLEEVRQYARAQSTTGLVVVVGGKVLMEYGDVEAIGYMAGGRYSIMAMVFGKYVENGAIDLHLTLEEMGIDDRGGLLPLERSATIEQLLTNRSGVYHPTPFGDRGDASPPRGSVAPGTRYVDHHWGGLASKAIFELLTGRDLFQAIGEDLAHPIGLQDFNWKRQNPGHERTRSNFTIYNLYVSTRDLARFGQLMLQKGEWRGQKLVPRDWVERITTVVTPPEEMTTDGEEAGELGFGYQWWAWHNPDPEGPFAGAFTYKGAYGQYLTVLPMLDMVVAHQVFAGWFGPPEGSVTWDQYMGILERLIRAKLP